MLKILAKTFVWALTAYASLGVLFAVPFVWRRVQRLDEEATGSGAGFRLLIMPGVAALWPMFVYRMLRSVTEPPTEKNPHR